MPEKRLARSPASESLPDADRSLDRNVPERKLLGAGSSHGAGRLPQEDVGRADEEDGDGEPAVRGEEGGVYAGEVPGETSRCLPHEEEPGDDDRRPEEPATETARKTA